MRVVVAALVRRPVLPAFIVVNCQYASVADLRLIPFQPLQQSFSSRSVGVILGFEREVVSDVDFFVRNLNFFLVGSDWLKICPNPGELSGNSTIFLFQFSLGHSSDCNSCIINDLLLIILSEWLPLQSLKVFY